MNSLLASPETYRYKHGTTSSYSHGGCRCEACKEAKRSYEGKRRKDQARGDRRTVDASRARAHLLWLIPTKENDYKAAMSARRVSQLSGVSYGTICKILYNYYEEKSAPEKRCLRETEARILSVSRIHSRSPRLVSAGKTLSFVDCMTSFGLTKTGIAQALGKSKRASFEIGRSGRVRIESEGAVERLHFQVWKNVGLFRLHCACDLPEHMVKWLESR